MEQTENLRAAETPGPDFSGDFLGDKVKELFGLPYLFPYQRLVISNILEASQTLALPGDDRDTAGNQIVILPTGAGKSLCFQLPAMLLPGPTLVLYPILSLMADLERRLRDRGFDPVLLRGGQSDEERRGIWEKLGSGKSRFIIANPEVLLSPKVMDRLGSLGIAHVVIDEAHCVSEWGESFRPSYLRIGEIIRACGSGPARESGEGPRRPLVTAFTATASAPVLEKIESYIFEDRGAHRIIGNPDRSNIRYAAQGCIVRDLAVRDLIARNELPAIVFCSTRGGAERLARYLAAGFAESELGSQIRFYHAGLSREEKTAVETWFFSNPRAVLTATCAYGMGVDKADIRTVIHRDCPPSVEAYLQESGRAGRDGKLSRAYLLWGPADKGQLRRARDEKAVKRIRDLLDYADDTGACRREKLLALLDYQGSGESPPENCCDVCEGEARRELREEESLLQFFRRHPRSYTPEEAAELLGRAEQFRWSAGEAKTALQELIKLGTLRVLKGFPWQGRISPPPLFLRKPQIVALRRFQIRFPRKGGLALLAGQRPGHGVRTLAPPGGV
ncbi:MAG: RecQ family ATP-dependent DNA helicase, partial [Treponema sp.]|nr:RecQ family ATP-dependent DNA helicase [Treponema sp.]